MVIKYSVACFMVLFMFLSTLLNAQNVAITDDNGYTADESAMLDVKSTTKGLLVPRLTTNQRISIANPAQGLLVFDTDLNEFYFRQDTTWYNLTHGTPSGLWGQDGSMVFLNDTTFQLGIGTKTPAGKFEVKSDPSITQEEPIFGVVNNNGDTVFAVYQGGVRINVDDSPSKVSGNKGGFAVGGFSQAKGGPIGEYMWVTPDSVRIYIEESDGSKATGSKGGFAVGGFSPAKNSLTYEYMRVCDDSIRMWIDESGPDKATGSKGGFAVGGFSDAKGVTNDYLNISGADSSEVINPSEPRILWYPIKEAFMAGQVLVQDPDSVGSYSWASGYESKAVGNYSQALGNSARSFGTNSTAIGNFADARGSNSYAFGDEALATGTGSYAFGSVGRDTSGVSTGNPTLAAGDYSMAIGLGAATTRSGALALGVNTLGDGKNSVALGDESTTTGTSSIAMGYGNIAAGTRSTAIGSESEAYCTNSISIGYSNLAGAGDAMHFVKGYSLALGFDNTALSYALTFMPLTRFASVAIGRNVSTDGKDAFGFGSGIDVQADNVMAFNISGSTVSYTTDDVYSFMGASVEIGTTSPDATLDVKTNSSGYAIHVEEYSGGEEWQIGTASSGNMNFYDGTTHRVTFEDNTGDIGINELYPACDIHIKQDNDLHAIRMENSDNSNYWEIGSGSGANKFIFSYNGTVMSRIDDADGSYDVASDKRLKQDIEPVGEVLDKVLQLKPSKFYLKSSDKKDPKSYGFIAQDVEDLFPDLINTFYLPNDKTEYKGLSYDDFSILSIQAIIDLNKKLMTEVNKKESQINNLKAENDKMKERFDSLEKTVLKLQETLEQSASK